MLLLSATAELALVSSLDCPSIDLDLLEAAEFSISDSLDDYRLDSSTSCYLSAILALLRASEFNSSPTLGYDLPFSFLVSEFEWLSLSNSLETLDSSLI